MPHRELHCLATFSDGSEFIILLAFTGSLLDLLSLLRLGLSGDLCKIILLEFLGVLTINLSYMCKIEIAR